eukprot:9502683-Pyramimonas_sp.AAC.1
MAAAHLGPGGSFDLPPRTHDFMEIFSGKKAVSRGVAHFGYHGISVDIEEDLRHDFSTPHGFLLCLRALLVMKAGSLLFMAPPCGTWVWVSRGSTQRSVERPEGMGSACTEQANAL